MAQQMTSFDGFADSHAASKPSAAPKITVFFNTILLSFGVL